jgi:hypothetical protein
MCAMRRARVVPLATAIFCIATQNASSRLTPVLRPERRMALLTTRDRFRTRFRLERRAALTGILQYTRNQVGCLHSAVANFAERHRRPGGCFAFVMLVDQLCSGPYRGPHRSCYRRVIEARIPFVSLARQDVVGQRFANRVRVLRLLVGRRM